jgi:DNA-binding CsgD family transcriptional regulator
MGSVIEIGALQALALDQAGKRARALAAVAEVLALACPEGYLRVFADEGPAMATLVGELIARREGGPRHTAGAVPLDYLGRLLWAFERDRVSRPQSRLPATTLGSALVLTDRELEVLALLAAGKPNREIVDDLVVTVDTVKKHVTTSSTSSARPTAPRPSRVPASSPSSAEIRHLNAATQTATQASTRGRSRPAKIPPRLPPSGEDADAGRSLAWSTTAWCTTTWCPGRQLRSSRGEVAG